MGNIFAYGGQVTLIGLAIVFAALIILILCITLLSKVIRGITGVGNKAKTEAAPAAAPVAAPAPAAAPAPVQEAAPAVVEAAAEEEGEIVTDPQIIAVIAAAIACSDANSKLVIRSVRRSSGWKKAARDEAVCRF